MNRVHSPATWLQREMSVPLRSTSLSWVQAPARLPGRMCDTAEPCDEAQKKEKTTRAHGDTRMNDHLKSDNGAQGIQMQRSSDRLG